MEYVFCSSVCKKNHITITRSVLFPFSLYYMISEDDVKEIALMISLQKIKTKTKASSWDKNSKAL